MHLTNKQWRLFAPLLPDPSPFARGQPRIWRRQSLMDQVYRLLYQDLRRRFQPGCHQRGIERIGSHLMEFFLKKIFIQACPAFLCSLSPFLRGGLLWGHSYAGLLWSLSPTCPHSCGGGAIPSLAHIIL